VHNPVVALVRLAVSTGVSPLFHFSAPRPSSFPTLPTISFFRPTERPGFSWDDIDVLRGCLIQNGRLRRSQSSVQEENRRMNEWKHLRRSEKRGVSSGRGGAGGHRAEGKAGDSARLGRRLLPPS